MFNRLAYKMKHNTFIPYIVGIGAFVLMLGLAVGCSGYNDDRGVGDAPVDQQPDETRKVWVNGDQFPNVSAFCIGGNGIYTNTRQADPVDVVVSDPECEEGGILNG